MATLIKIDNNRRGYLDVTRTLFAHGTEQDSRNGRTIELRDVIIELADPFDAVPSGVRPGYQLAIGAVEALQLVGGFSDPQLTCEVAPNFKRFLDDRRLYGSYGTRTDAQFPVIAERLAADDDTRQAVVTLWNPALDAPGGKRDHPCTIAFDFLIRDNKLCMTTFMRSNDHWWGWPYDAWMFTSVQVTLANVLGYDVGTYTHHAVSYHIYEPHWALAQEMLRNAPEGEAVPTRQFGQWLGGWESASSEAGDVWDKLSGVGADRPTATETSDWYLYLLGRRRLEVVRRNYERLGVPVE